MKLNDLITALEGRENIELHIDGLQLHFTAQNTKAEWKEREVKSIRVDPKTYLGLIIHIKAED